MSHPKVAAYRIVARELLGRQARLAGVPITLITRAERRLNVRLPGTLRNFLLTVGRVHALTSAFNRLLPPKEWAVDHGKLVFWEENQAVVLWGIAAASNPPDDPAVYQGSNGDTVEWYVEHRHVSTFLAFMLHWEAAWGGMPFCGGAIVKSDVVKRRGGAWTYVGEVNHFKAYRKPGIAACIGPWDEQGWRLFLGARTERKLMSTVNELGVTLAPN
jgi:hypothetical protein